jgi:hypothetical protein
MEGRRNAALADMARDAEIERSDFLVRAGEQLERFMATHQARILELGGLVLIDDDPDYLAVAPDGTFRSRSRVFDEGTGQWLSDTEVIETAAELAELYNPADILQAFADSQAEDVGIGEPGEEGAPVADDGVYAEVADQWAAGQPEVREARDEATAALALYELALDFQDRSQRTEAGLIEQFENAAASLLGLVSALVLVEDDDEHLSLAVGGFRGRVIPEGGTSWEDISSPDQIVRYYDPTDIFGDLAEAIADTYPAVAGNGAGAPAGEAVNDADADGGDGDEADDDEADDDESDDDESDEAGDAVDGEEGLEGDADADADADGRR